MTTVQGKPGGPWEGWSITTDDSGRIVSLSWPEADDAQPKPAPRKPDFIIGYGIPRERSRIQRGVSYQCGTCVGHRKFTTADPDRLIYHARHVHAVVLTEDEVQRCRLE
jgi:hypothetical protein